MIRTPARAAAALLCVVLASGCGSDDTTASVAAPSSAPAAVTPRFSPSPTSDKDRLACRAIYDLPRGEVPSGVIPAAPARAAGVVAAEAKNGRIAQLGVDLVAAAEHLAAEPGDSRASLVVDHTVLQTFRACTSQFGGAPW
ncbi:hypothetical protein [Micromonospora echinospora]|uniref:hypothetical protein n=1 Tax=Micromonospora echinospora TaxID=1877 RepID=UPI003A8B5BE6